MCIINWQESSHKQAHSEDEGGVLLGALAPEGGGSVAVIDESELLVAVVEGGELLAAVAVLLLSRS
jgi:hypothetical protein